MRNFSNYFQINFVFFSQIKKKIFEGLAQETLSLCGQSLIRASDTIKKNKVGSFNNLKKNYTI
jgi:hypothetical protein